MVPSPEPQLSEACCRDVAPRLVLIGPRRPGGSPAVYAGMPAGAWVLFDDGSYKAFRSRWRVHCS